jgi:hypothetical protein
MKKTCQRCKAKILEQHMAEDSQDWWCANCGLHFYKNLVDRDVYMLDGILETGDILYWSPDSLYPDAELESCYISKNYNKTRLPLLPFDITAARLKLLLIFS